MGLARALRHGPRRPLRVWTQIQLPPPLPRTTCRLFPHSPCSPQPGNVLVQLPFQEGLDRRLHVLLADLDTATLLRATSRMTGIIGTTHYWSAGHALLELATQVIKARNPGTNFSGTLAYNPEAFDDWGLGEHMPAHRAPAAGG